MADKKSDKPEGSFLKTAVAAAPLATGVSYGAYKALQDRQLASRESPVQRAARALDEIQRSKVPIVDPKIHIQWMNRQAKYFADNPTVAKTAWIQAIRASDPLAVGALGLAGEGISTLPESEVASHITQVMAKQQSNLAQSVYRRFSHNVTALREQEFVGGATFTYDTLGGEILTSPTKFKVPTAAIQEQIARIEKSLGAAPDSTMMEFFTRQPWAQEGLGTYSVRFRAPIGDINMMLPTVSERGVLAAGITQQTRYIAPSIGIYDPTTKRLERISRTEFMLREFEESVLPDIQAGRITSRREAERAVTELQRRVIHTLETVPNVPSEYQTAAGKLYEEIRGKQMDIVVRQERYPGDGAWRYLSGFREPTEAEIADAMATHKLFGGVSPTAIAKGRVMTEDLSRLNLVPEATSWARRPESAYREYGLTEATRSQMDLERVKRFRTYESAASRMIESELTNPHLKAMYVDPEKYLGVMEAMEMGEGEAIARKGISNTLEFEAMRTQKLASIRKDILTKLRAGEIPQLNPGEIIGWTPEGEQFKMAKEMRITRGVEHASRSQGEYLALHYMDTRRLQSNDKLFQDLKAVVQLREDTIFNNQVRHMARNEHIANGVDIIISMDELRKDSSKHVSQMISAGGEILAERQGPLTPALRAFRSDPERITNIMKGIASRGPQGYDHNRFIQEMMKFFTTEADVTAKEFGAIFGSVPIVAGGDKEAIQLMRSAIGIRPELEEQVLRRLAGGVAKVTYGGPAQLTGAGAMGSLEPRIFELLSSPQYGKLGGELADDFARRLAFTNPEKRAVHETLGKSLASIGGKVTRGAGDRVWEVGRPGFEYSQASFQKWIEQGGGWLKPGKGLNEVFVPGATTVQAMRPYKVGDINVRGDLSDIYHRLAQRADKMYAPDTAISISEMKQEMEAATRALGKHWAPAGKGMGAYQRGKLIGSRFLRGVSRAGKIGMNQLATESSNLMVAGIPRSAAKEMFDEMAGFWEKNALEQMRERAMRGEEFGGMLVRHPIIGPFSAQHMRFKVIDAPGNQIVLPEKTANLKLRIGEDLVEKQVRLGPLVGLAGDKDADIFSAMLVSPDSEHAVRRATLAADSEFAQRYTQHQVRYQLLKAQTPKGAETLLSVEQRMIADVQKLGTTQRWVPRLSVELSAAKRALGAHATGRSAADAAMLLEWLEQTPISAKHLSAGQVRGGQLESLLGRITSSIQYGDAQRLQDSVTEVLKNNAVAKELLVGNIKIEEGGEEVARLMGGNLQKEIQGINLEAAIKTLMNSMHEYRISGEAHTAEKLAGRGAGLAIKDIPEVVAKHMSHMSAGVQGVFASVSRATNVASNFIGTAGRGIIKHHKALGLGFAGSLAMGAILSSPPEQIGPGGGLIPKGMKLNAGKAAGRMRPDDILPPHQPIGRPRAPNMLEMRRAMISGSGPSPQINVRARSRYMINNESLAQGIGMAGGQGRRVNVNLRDNRSALNPHLAANKLL